MNESWLDRLSGTPADLPITAFSDGLDQLLAYVDSAQFGGASNTLVADLLRAVEQVKNRIPMVDNVLTIAAEESNLKTFATTTSTAVAISAILHISQGEARRRVHEANQLQPQRNNIGQTFPPRRPHLAHTVRSGCITPEQTVITLDMTDYLDKARHLRDDQIAHAERQLVALAQSLEPAQYWRAAQHIVNMLHPDGFLDDDNTQRSRRYLRLTRLRRGGFKVTGQLTDEAGLKVEKLLHSLATPRPRNGDGKDNRPVDYRMHDALHHVADAWLDSGQLPVNNGMAPQVYLTVNLEALQSGHGGGWASTGHYLGAATIRKFAARAEVIPIVLGTKGQILDVGRRYRNVTTGIRDGLFARDGGCTMPACNAPPEHCQAHHIGRRWWGGEVTSLETTTLLCGYHNRREEELGWNCRMIDGLPWWLPPTYIDPEQKPVLHPRLRALRQLSAIFTPPKQKYVDRELSQPAPAANLNGIHTGASTRDRQSVSLSPVRH
ncbi:MAG: DUF222 domain-containing protein [Antricoccus sp.]